LQAPCALAAHRAAHTAPPALRCARYLRHCTRSATAPPRRTTAPPRYTRPTHAFHARVPRTCAELKMQEVWRDELRAARDFVLAARSAVRIADKRAAIAAVDAACDAASAILHRISQQESAPPPAAELGGHGGG